MNRETRWGNVRVLNRKARNRDHWSIENNGLLLLREGRWSSKANAGGSPLEEELAVLSIQEIYRCPTVTRAHFLILRSIPRKEIETERGGQTFRKRNKQWWDNFTEIPFCTVMLNVSLRVNYWTIGTRSEGVYVQILPKDFRGHWEKSSW